MYIQFPPVLPHNYSLTTHDKQKITSLKNYNHFPYCQLKFPSSKQRQSHVISAYSVYVNKAVATITNVVLSEFQLMIRMGGIKKCFVVWLLLNFHSARNCDSFYSLALYRQVLLVINNNLFISCNIFQAIYKLKVLILNIQHKKNLFRKV